jgi:cytochrome c
MRGIGFCLVGLIVAVVGAGGGAAADGDAENGARVFQACAACHSLAPGRHMTGPSLAGIWGRKAGTAPGFARYSPALQSADVVWDAPALDAWLKSPSAFVPGNLMNFSGLPDEQARADLLAYLQSAESSGDAAMSPAMPDLKRLEPDRQVRAIRYCGDSYFVTTEAGETIPFWEFNLRFKSDSSASGPTKGRPVLARGGMMGDRASVVFASPEEIGGFVDSTC